MKQYTIIVERRGREREVTGTIQELCEHFGYTLLKGKSWEHERGNKRINTAPKTIDSLVSNLNNAAANGFQSTWYYKK